MKKISLSQGMFALVDDGDFEYLSQFKWFAASHRKTHYAQRNKQTRHGVIHMHRVIMKTNDAEQVDHIDGNGLNNQKSNLRNCSREENQRNRASNKNNVSGYKGVAWQKSAKIFRVQIMANRKKVHIGYFKNPIEAAKAYDNAAREYHGKFAKTNF